jgi:hypothetical protein
MTLGFTDWTPEEIKVAKEAVKQKRRNDLKRAYTEQLRELIEEIKEAGFFVDIEGASGKYVPRFDLIHTPTENYKVI